MEINKILHADYLDLIFDNRNKNYGGYELRKHYQNRAVKALGIMLATLVLAIGIPYLMNLGAHGNTTALNPTQPIIDIAMKEILLPEKKILPPVTPPAETHNVSAAKTIKNTVPEIVENSKAPDVKPPEIKDPELAIAGPVTSEGKDGIHPATTTTPPSGPAGDSDFPPKGKIGGGDIETITNSPDVVPEYPGGMAALLQYLQNNIRYPNDARENEIQGRVIVRFIVNAQGKIEGAEVQRGIGHGCDKEALRVVNAMKPWKPGQVKGKPVKVYYTLPITFKLS